MIAGFGHWWRLRTVREQRMLFAMFVLIGGTVFWLGLVRPLGSALEGARNRHDRAVAAHAEAQDQAVAIRKLERAPRPSNVVPLRTGIGQSATAAGFATARIEPEAGGGVHVVIDAVRPQAFFAWIAMLERQGLVVERLSARANSDASLAVDTSFRVRAR